jgi:hypothetical protein
MVEGDELEFVGVGSVAHDYKFDACAPLRDVRIGLEFANIGASAQVADKVRRAVLGVRFAVISGDGFVPDEDVARCDFCAHGVSIIAHGRLATSRPCVGRSIRGWKVVRITVVALWGSGAMLFASRHRY